MNTEDKQRTHYKQVADAIREQEGSAEKIKASTFPSRIRQLQTNTENTSEYFNEEISSGTNNYPGIITVLKKLPDKLKFSDSSMHSMFRYGIFETLDLSNFETSNLTNMYYAFYECRNLTSLDLSNFVTNKLNNMQCTFYGCRNLASLILRTFDMGKVTNVSNMLHSTIKLRDLEFGYDLGKAFTQKTQNYANYKLDLSSCTNLTHESLMSVINGLYDLNLTYDVENGGTLYRQQLVLGSTNLDKLTQDEIAIATDKGWTVS